MEDMSDWWPGFYPPDDESDDSDDNQKESEETLDSIKHSKTINFPIRASYTKWESREAFRELVQNWRDAIIRSFDLSEDDFKVTRAERKDGPATKIVYTAVNSSSLTQPKTCLGYIRFKTTQGHDNGGIIEIVNRSTTLQPWHLDLGGTSKADDTSQAGAHGEGLKVALLILMRRPWNFAIRCISGGFDWSFNFTTQGKLSAHLERMSPASIRSVEAKSERESRGASLLPFPASCEKDVQFVIGETVQGRNEKGASVRRRAVPLATFLHWTEAALFLQEIEDGGIISTKYGSLLTAPQLSGRVYLKGLLLKDSRKVSASVTGKRLKFGYDFKAGTTNRERQSMTTATEEAQALWRIWNNVLDTKPDLVAALSEMLNVHSVSQEYADVAQAANYLEEATARKLKDYLCSGKFRGKWYYQADEQSQNTRFKHVVEGLGCTPIKLSRDYWDILKYYDLLRTAEQEEQLRFSRAPVSQRERNTTFSQSIFRLLRASFRACSQTSNYRIEFVQAGQLSLHICVYQQQHTIKVHEQWLEKPFAAKELGLEVDELAETDLLFYAVGTLFRDAVEQLPDGRFKRWSREGRTPSWYRRQEVRRTEQRLLNYARIHQVTHSQCASATPGLVDLTVGWKGSHGGPVSVKLFHSSANISEQEVLIASDLESPNGPWPIKTTVASEYGVTITGLRLGPQLVVVVHTFNDPGSFLIMSESFVIRKPASIPIPIPPRPPRPSVVLFEKGDEVHRIGPRLMVNSKWFDATSRDGQETKGFLLIPNDDASSNFRGKRNMLEDEEEEKTPWKRIKSEW